MAESERKYWNTLIAEQEAGGQKVRPFCPDRGITEPAFYCWRKRLREKGTVRFALLETKAVIADTASALDLVLRNGDRLRIFGRLAADCVFELQPGRLVDLLQLVSFFAALLNSLLRQAGV